LRIFHFIFENVIVEGMFSGEPVPVRIQEFLPMSGGKSIIGQLYGGDFGVWSLPDGRLIREPSSDYQEYSEILAVSFDGKTAAVPQYRIPESWDNSLMFIETDADVAGFSPDTSLLVGDPWLYAEDYEYGGMLNVWQVEPKQLLNTVGEETEPVTAVHFTKDGQLIISSARDGIVRLWGIP
jgi:WD40 repeat protein